MKNIRHYCSIRSNKLFLLQNTNCATPLLCTSPSKKVIILRVSAEPIATYYSFQSSIHFYSFMLTQLWKAVRLLISLSDICCVQTMYSQQHHYHSKAQKVLNIFLQTFRNKNYTLICTVADLVLQTLHKRIHVISGLFYYTVCKICTYNVFTI